MKLLSGPEEKEAINFINQAIDVAKLSPCFRSKCGSVLIKDKQIIGSGFNSPPLNTKLDHCLKDDLPDNFKSDKTCCVHAEQRAIMDALKNNPQKINGSRLYFIRVDLENNILKAGQPYCTICSKMALDSGVSEFVLWHEEGICVYNTQEYNQLSFSYR